MKKQTISRMIIFGAIMMAGLMNALSALADNPFAVPTFHCLSIYWTPDDNNGGEPVSVEYRVSGEQTWHSGLSMRHNPVATAESKAEYRGSIVNLRPNTSYDISLQVGSGGETASFTAQTLSDEFPVAVTIRVKDRTTTATIDSSGTANGYVVYDGTGYTIDLSNNSDYGIVVNASYVILRGFTIRNTKKHGILISGGHNIVIEDCDISAWGTEDENGFGVDLQMGICGTNPSSYGILVQRCKIHHPSWDTNSWTELHDGSYHPAGPQGLGFSDSLGNNVIRYNEIWSDSTHYFNDVIGYGANASYRGFPGPDSDIYGNYFANSQDDAIESEGGNQNVRIWNNYTEHTYVGLGNAPTSVGPLYAWRNIFGPTGLYSVKMGYSTSISWMTGEMFLFNNTLLQTASNDGGGGLGTSDGGQRDIKHCTSRNNILHVRTTDTYSISCNVNNNDNDYDYDLLSKLFPSGQELSGITGTPTYQSSTPFTYSTKTGNFQLTSGSLGYDSGTAIANFCESYSGTAPDIGAHEADTPDMVFGLNSKFDPAPTNTETGIVHAEPATQNVLLTQSANLRGTVEWLPVGQLTTAWSKVSGPGTVTFSDSSALNTTATFSQLGTYVINFAADDSLLNDSQNVTVIVKANSYPVATANPSTQLAALESVAHLSGAVSDDGLPGPLEITWLKYSGPGTVTIHNPGLLNTTASFSEVGTYVIKFKASDLSTNGYQYVEIVVASNTAPVVTVTPTTQTIPLSGYAILSGSITDDGLPNGQLTNILWEKKTGPGTVTFSNPTSLDTTAIFSTAGTYTVRLKAFDGLLYGTRIVTVIVQ